MRTREVHRLVAMVADPPRVAPRWLTPELVKLATPLDGLDLIERAEMRQRRILLLCAVARCALADLQRSLAGAREELSTVQPDVS